MTPSYRAHIVAGGKFIPFALTQPVLPVSIPLEDSKRQVNPDSQDQSELIEPAEQDAQWVIATQSGDLGAYDKLVERHRRQAVSVAFRLLNRIEDASDVAQDAFVRAYQNLEKLDEPSKFAGWLMRIVTNLSLNFRKSRARHQMADVDDTLKFDAAPRDPTGAKMITAAADDSLSQQELKRVVREAIDDLPEKQRTALTLFALEGRSQKEVADIMECSIELVKWNVFQARKKLRTMLADYVED